MTTSRVLSWVAVAVTAAALLVTPLLNLSHGISAREVVSEVVFYLPGILASLVIGMLLVRRPDAAVIGWLLLAGGLCLALSGLSDAYATYGLAHDFEPPGSRAAAIWFTHGWPPLFAWVVAIAFLFPDGHLPGPRWRLPALAGASMFVLTTVAGVLSPKTLDAPFEDVPPLAGLSQPVAVTLQSVGLVGMTLTLALAAAAVVVRFRRARGVERQQLKWVALAGLTIPVAIVLGIVDGMVGAEEPGLITGLSTGLALTSVPVAIGVAVLRYRLYDVDRLISTAVLYLTLSVVLAGLFLAVAVAGGVWLGRGSPVSTAAATAAVTLTFRPLRTWLQRRVARRFDRSRYLARATMQEFLDRLRSGQVQPEDVEEALGEGLQDPSLRLMFWFPGQGVHLDRRGAVVEPLPDQPSRRTPVERGDELLATLLHDATDAERSGVLADVVRRAGLAIEVARLRVEVRRQVVEVQESRARLVSAAVEERRRLERDLHDGAQQRLVSIGLDLRHLQHEMGAGAIHDGLDAAVTELVEAIDELRELAHGVRPSTLDAGLSAALAELASRSSIATEVTITDARFPADIEAAAYFVASEALANAVKHSGASRVVVTAVKQPAGLQVVVSDDGRGGARPRDGSGLAGLADRVSAVGGRLAVESGTGRGTRLEAVFPCAS